MSALPPEVDQDEPTRAENPAAGRQTEADDALTVPRPPTNSTTASTPLEAMHYDEWRRTILFCKLLFIVIVGGLFSLLLVAGDPIAKLVLALAALAAGLANLWVLIVMRSPAEYTTRRMLYVSVVMVSAAQMVIYFFGVFSPAPALVLMGIYFYSKAGDRRSALVNYLICAVFYAVVGGLIAGGALADRGLVTPESLAQSDRVMIVVLVELVYLIAFLAAAGSRDIQHDSIEQLDRAIREIAVRDKLLVEARVDLEQALRVGDRGRYTGETIGAYTLGALLGRGGMGEVYEAVHAESSESAAVKLLHPTALADPDQLNRFLREIETIAMLEAPEIVRLLDYGSFAENVPYLVMERLEGEDLASILRDRRRLPGPEVVELIRASGRGLTVAWELGVVHRDIKPQNLFRHAGDGDPVWKILDFGVSKLATTAGTLTQGKVVGTPSYMAPEQARGHDVDYQADLYALAVIAYRCLTGRPAFAERDVPATLFEVVYNMPTRPSGLVDIDPDIDLALAIGLAKSPRDRFRTPDALAGAIERALEGRLSRRVRVRAAKLLGEHPWREQ